jgi:hypothetical protein
MHPIRSTKRSTFFLAIGAAAAYLFDPQAGRARRDNLLSKLQQYAPSSRTPEDRTGPTPEDRTGPTAGHDVDPAFHSTSATKIVPDSTPDAATPADAGASAHVA